MVYPKHITLNALISSNVINDVVYYVKIIREFNNVYSIINNLNITIKMTPIKINVDKKAYENYVSTFSTTLSKNKKTYDLIQFYSTNSKSYGQYFEDLRNYFTDEELEVYDKRILDKTCTNSENKLIGLVMHIQNYNI